MFRNYSRAIREILNSIHDSLFVQDFSGNILYVNQRACDLYGYTYEEALRIKSSELSLGISPYSEAEAKQWVEKAQNNGEQIFEWIGRKKNGETFWAEIALRCVKIDKKNVIVVSVRDIEDRKKGQETLYKSEEKYRILVDSLPDISIHLFDHDKKFIIAGGSEISKNGFDKKLIEGRTLAEVYPPEVVNLMSPLYEKALQGEASTIEHCYGDFWYHQHAVPVYDSKQNIFAGIVISQNITERKRMEDALKESEMHFRSVTQSAIDAIITIDENSNIVDWNKGAENIFGYTTEELTGKNLSVIIPQQYIERHIKGMERLIQGKDPHIIGSIVEVSGIDKSGKEFPVELSLSDWNSSKGHFYTGIIRDITERKLAERAVTNLNQELEIMVNERTAELENTNDNLHTEINLRKKKEELIKLQLQEKEIMLKEIHHRVKNNMQIIISMLHLQASFLHDKKAIDILQDSQNRITTMALIHEKLYQTKDFAKINFKEYLNSLCEHLCSTYASTSSDSQIEYSLHAGFCTFDIEKTISLGLLINELISNSFKHGSTFNGKCKIEISLNKSDENNYSLIIKDNGKGLPENFDLNTLKSLGLQLVVLMTEQIQGKLDVHSSHKGTTFSITFPEK